LIYIKENNQYSKYYLSDDGKLICRKKDNSECVILYGISGEFDGIVTDSGEIHFVLQTLSGEMIYLKKESDTWKKYTILKSRKGLQKITNIRLAASGENLCAFYIMNHQGKKLLVKHIFSENNMVIEPEVLDVAGGREEFVLLTHPKMPLTVIYRNAAGECRKLCFEKNFRLVTEESVNLKNEILCLDAVAYNDEIFFTYTIPAKNSVALMFCNGKTPDEEKIVTFGIARNLFPHIMTVGNDMILQWEENGMIMQSESRDFGKNFTKPKPLGNECKFAKIRQIYSSGGLVCNKCAVYNMKPFVSGAKKHGEIDRKGVQNTLNNFRFINKEINGNVTNEEIMKKINGLKNDIDQMGKTLISMCSFLEDIKKFKFDAENIHEISPHKVITDNLSGDDIGEINKDNLEIFENTKIDDILPDNTEIHGEVEK